MKCHYYKSNLSTVGHYCRIVYINVLIFKAIPYTALHSNSSYDIVFKYKDEDTCEHYTMYDISADIWMTTHMSVKDIVEEKRCNIFGRTLHG